MRKNILFLITIIISNFLLFSQTETEIIGVNYSNYSRSDYNDKIYESATKKVDAFINYGHDIGKKSKLFYHASYQNFEVDTKINYIIIPQDSFLFPSIPDYSIFTFATGMNNELKNNWNLTNILSFTIANDISKDKLNSNNYFRTFSLVKKKKSTNLTYGFGVYFDNTREDINVLPIISLQLENEKRGLKLFFPRSLKLWEKINANSYIQLSSNIDSNTLDYKNFNDFNVEILSIITELTYNYILSKKFKLKAGIGLPYQEFEYKSDLEDFKTTQKGKINFNFGLSYVIFQDN
jgi:hypothetical protein